MTELHTRFTPDWVLAPGESVLDMAEERGWTQGQLAQRLGYTEKHVSQLVNGKVPITVDAAQRLERVLGGSLDFWLKLEVNYQNHKARLAEQERHTSWVPWLDELPVRDLMRSGAIPIVRNDTGNKPVVVESCLRFFGVASPNEWRDHYGGMQIAFRRSREEQSDVGAISAWLRQGEQLVEKLNSSKYHKGRFTSALNEIRNLTCERPQVFHPRMTELLGTAGVLLAIVPSIPRARVSGVARWLSPTKPLIQLSLYGKTNDKFWFTFFHEAAHILLHAENREDKKSIFLDDPTASHSTDSHEKQANQWAGSFLIPAGYECRLGTLLTKTAVKAFAREIGIHPGIVVGRLQHDHFIKPSWMNDLKVSFEFTNRNDRT